MVKKPAPDHTNAEEEKYELYYQYLLRTERISFPDVDSGEVSMAITRD